MATETAEVNIKHNMETTAMNSRSPSRLHHYRKGGIDHDMSGMKLSDTTDPKAPTLGTTGPVTSDTTKS